MLSIAQKYEILESLHLFNGKITAFNLARHYNSIYDHKDGIDWHPISDFLDYLNAKKILRVAGRSVDGMTIYEFNK